MLFDAFMMYEGPRSSSDGRIAARFKGLSRTYEHTIPLPRLHSDNECGVAMSRAFEVIVLSGP